MATALHSLAGLSEVSNNVADWVAGVQQLTQPDRVYWCDGSPAEEQRLRGELLARGELRELNQKSFPGCYLYRSHPGDVARVEITKTDAYDLIGRVVETLPRPAARLFAGAPPIPPAETLTRISTGAALRVLG